MKTVVSTKNAPAAIGPYSQAISVNGLLFTSGIIPADPATGEIAEGLEAQANLAFSNLKHLIEDAGSSMKDVVKTTVFISDMENFAKINEIYAKYFEEPYPARSCVQAARLPKDVMLEVEAAAVLK